MAPYPLRPAHRRSVCSDYVHMRVGKINYNGRMFRAVSLSESSQVDPDTIFAYHQRGTVLFGEYSGGAIEWGSIVGRVADDGGLNFIYQHISKTGELRSGRCESTPERLENGKIRLHERWQWHPAPDGSGGESGESVVEEI